ncbi:hypothetical protein QCA50_015202 [Cerrena zonata]|uniref:Uncharacterized protein n=1 Tax=Cerrena zonata TaxID=2478898 RepID=A0AAW0FKA2_9APHY
MSSDVEPTYFDVLTQSPSPLTEGDDDESTSYKGMETFSILLTSVDETTSQLWSFVDDEYSRSPVEAREFADTYSFYAGETLSGRSDDHALAEQVHLQPSRTREPDLETTPPSPPPFDSSIHVPIFSIASLAGPSSVVISPTSHTTPDPPSSPLPHPRLGRLVLDRPRHIPPNLSGFLSLPSSPHPMIPGSHSISRSLPCSPTHRSFQDLGDQPPETIPRISHISRRRSHSSPPMYERADRYQLPIQPPLLFGQHPKSSSVSPSRAQPKKKRVQQKRRQEEEPENDVDCQRPANRMKYMDSTASGTEAVPQTPIRSTVRKRTHRTHITNPISLSPSSSSRSSPTSLPITVSTPDFSFPGDLRSPLKWTAPLVHDGPPPDCNLPVLSKKDITLVGAPAVADVPPSEGHRKRKAGGEDSDGDDSRPAKRPRNRQAKIRTY